MDGDVKSLPVAHTPVDPIQAAAEALAERIAKARISTPWTVEKVLIVVRGVADGAPAADIMAALNAAGFRGISLHALLGFVHRHRDRIPAAHSWGHGWRGQPRKRHEADPARVQHRPASDGGRAKTCQWIEKAEGPFEDSDKCGAPVQPGSSFCPEHHARVWVPASKAEGRRICGNEEPPRQSAMGAAE